MRNANVQPVATGMWGDYVSWELRATSESPPEQLITAVACVAIANENGDVVLTSNQRGGWEMLAGHIEPGEDLRTALAREALEEGGFTISDVLPIGYRKITAHQKPKPDSRAAAYPYPASYMAYYLALTEQPLAEPTGEEITESKVFSPEELDLLERNGDLNNVEHTIIKLGLDAWRGYSE